MNIVFALIAVVLILIMFWLIYKPKKSSSKKIISDEKTSVVTQVESKKLEEKPREISWKDRLSRGLLRTREEIFSKFESIISGNKIDAEHLESLEELLYTADIGPTTVTELIESLKKEIKSKEINIHDLKNHIYRFINLKMNGIQSTVDNSLYQFDPTKKGVTKVIMIVGVNGAGKTTTIGKLATKLKNQGASVYVGACDTFRAAAVDQLQVWCDRAGAKMIRAADGADPSGVAYETLQKALSDKVDYCILDTAGRLHTKNNLMDELSKSKKVLSKLDPLAPHSTLLVVDAITGQNALKQAEEFNKALQLNGIVFTKCDGSAKAGNAISIVQTLKIPIVYIGVGEMVEDLEIFNLNDYLSNLLGIEETPAIH